MVTTGRGGAEGAALTSRCVLSCCPPGLRSSHTQIGNLVAKHRQDTDLEMWWWAVNIVEFSIVAALLVVVYWFLFINLRKRVAAFLVTLLQQEERRKKEAATAAASASASAAAVLSVQASKRAALQKKEQREKESATQQEQATEQAEDVGADALPSVVPLLSPASPSDGVVELSEVGRADGDGDGNDNGGDAAATKTKHLLVGARSATLTHATSSSSSLQLPNSPTPGSSTLLLPPEAPLSPGGNTVHIRLVPSKTAARAVKPSLAQVAPAPTPAPSHAPRASTSASSVAAGAEAGTSAASVPTSSATASPSGTAALSQSEARLAELYGALRKLNLLTALVTVLLLGTGCVQIPNLQRYMRGETLSSVVRSPTADSDGFPFLSGASTCMNQGALMAILYAPTQHARALPQGTFAASDSLAGLLFSLLRFVFMFCLAPRRAAVAAAVCFLFPQLVRVQLPARVDGRGAPGQRSAILAHAAARHRRGGDRTIRARWRQQKEK